ncbi:MAG TPA: cyclophilin-like fold protein [Candidatus Nitrosopolaris sp.]|nr:cyclophilin-like fold protein [Candidatus Nitrosopolaris sp.]
MEISNKGVVDCEIIRHLSPITTKIILKGLPLKDRIHKLGENLVYIETGLTIGAEKQRSRFKRGEMAYLTSNGAICIFVKDSVPISAMNPIGVVKSNLHLAESSQTGDIMILRLTS